MAVPMMTRWDQTYVVICGIVLSFGVAAVAIGPQYALPVIFFCAALLVFLRVAVVVLAEFDEMRERLDGVDRRTARIDGHLFGIATPQDPANGE